MCFVMCKKEIIKMEAGVKWIGIQFSVEKWNSISEEEN